MTELFPLALTPFETFMLRASWSEEPMMNDTTWFFRGTLHRESFEAALEHAMLMHPLFRCRVDWSVRGRPRWVLTDDRILVHWGDSSNPPERWYDDFDLTVELGIRVWVAPVSEGVSRLSIRVHHAVTDGVGTGRFRANLMQHYSVLRSAPGAAMSIATDSDPNLLRLRSSVALGRTLRERVSRALRVVRQGRLRATPLAAPRSMAPNTWSDAKHAVAIIEGAAFDNMRAFAKSRGVPLHDHLVAALFRTLVAWNERHGTPNATDRLRIMVPTNERDSRHASMPAANCVGFSLMDRSPSDCVDPDRLLSSVARETLEIRGLHLGASFLDFLEVNDAIARLRGKLVPRKRTRRSSRCEATALLSYFGDIGRALPQGPRDAEGRPICGDITLLRVAALVSRQDQTRIGLTAMYLGREFVLCINPDRTCFDYAHALEFLSLYKAQLLVGVRVDKAIRSEIVASALAD